MRNFLSASQIAALGLPGLPATKVGIRAFADREGWPYEEKKGVGGTRRVYDVPVKYFPGAVVPDEDVVPSDGRGSDTSFAIPKVIGTIAAGKARVDVKKLALAMRTLDEWERERGLTINAERRPAVISLLYDFLERNEGKDMETLLQALG